MLLYIGFYHCLNKLSSELFHIVINFLGGFLLYKSFTPYKQPMEAQCNQAISIHHYFAISSITVSEGFVLNLGLSPPSYRFRRAAPGGERIFVGCHATCRLELSQLDHHSFLVGRLFGVSYSFADHTSDCVATSACRPRAPLL